MKWVYIFGWFLLTLPVFGDESPNVTLQTHTYFPKVNPINGEYVEEVCDLTVASCAPLAVRRFYNHLAPRANLYSNWRINPETFIRANFDYKKLEQNVLVGSRNGGLVLLQKHQNKNFSFDPEIQSSWTNAGEEDISGQTNPKNISLSYWRVAEKKDKFSYAGRLIDGSGRIVEFETKKFKWLDNLELQGEKLQPSCWTPYYCPIKKETLPNGNFFIYTYEIYDKEWHKDYPRHYRIKEIQSKNSQGESMGWIKFEYQHKKSNEYKLRDILITGSDGRSVRLGSRSEIISYTSAQDAKYFNLISQSARLDSPKIQYFYDSQNRLEKIVSPEGREFRTSYDKEGKVAAQYAPVGPQGEFVKIASFDYRTYSTEVINSEGLLLNYRYNYAHRLSAIEKYCNQTLHSIEKSQWDDEGQLISKSLVSPDKKVVRSKTYTYDSHGNVLEETLRGNLTGLSSDESYTIFRTYSQDGFNLKESETDGSGLITRYTYKPGTNLLRTAHIYYNDCLVKRLFYDYDASAVCIKKIIDDGKTEDPNNLIGVTYRHITLTKPKASFPCFGLPEEIEERTIEALGNEILLQRTVYTYHPSGKIEKEELYDAANSLSSTKIYEYDEHERLSKSTDPLGHVTTYAYDANFNLIKQKDTLSEHQWEYDAANRCILENRSGLITRKEYNTQGHLIASTDECGQITRYTLNPLGQILCTTSPDGSTIQKQYDCMGNEISLIDPSGYMTKKEYNARGQPIHIFYPDGTEEHFVYALNGNLVTSIDKQNCRTQITYDLFNRPIKKEIFSQDGNLLKSTAATYNAFHILSETDPGGMTTTYTYDFTGRKLSERKHDAVIFYFYDTLGRQNCIQKGDVRTFYEFDTLGHTIEIRIEDLNGALHFQENMSYDPHGNRSSTTHCGGTTRTFYNSADLPVKIVSPDGSQTTIFYSYDSFFTKTTLNPSGISYVETYDACRRIKEQTTQNALGEIIQKSEYEYDPSGNKTAAYNHIYEGTIYTRTISTKWTYGPLNKVSSQLESNQKLTQYQYNKQGLLDTLIKPNGVRLNYSYDALGRLRQLTSSLGDIDYSYTYDRCDRILSIYDGHHDTTMQRIYDVLGHLLQETLGSKITLQNTYDVYGRRTAQIFPDKTQATYTYRGGYLYQISYSGKTSTYAVRNLSGKPTHIQTPIGNILLSYDSSLRLKEYTSPSYTASEHRYDPQGNLLSYHTSDLEGILDHTYTYDDLNQITSEMTHTYAYDSLNNRIQKDTHSHFLNDLSELINDGIHSYTYDLNGNLTQAGPLTLIYDSLDRLTQVTKEGEIYEYIYDALHRRITKKTPSETIHYIWDEQNEIGSSKGDLRVLGEGLGAEIGAALFIKFNHQLYIPFHDHQGSIVSLIDLNGTPQATYRFTAFGEELISTPLCPWRFASKRLDEESGLIYFGRRYYTPQTARWITPDPQGFSDGPNLYAYVHNNPLIACDLYGLITHPFSSGRPLRILSQWAFKGLEFIGRHLLPIPNLSYVVEGIGRWGAGGNYSDLGTRSNGPQMIVIPGKKVEGLSYCYMNGMSVSLQEAYSCGTEFSRSHGDVEVTLFYNPTRGFVIDVIDSLLAKFGMRCPYEKMCTTAISSQLKASPQHQFRINAHSKAAIHLMNIGKAIGSEARKQMDVYAFGPATLIPSQMFRSAYNYVSPLDPVPMTSPLRDVNSS